MDWYFFYAEVTWVFWENNVRKKCEESVILMAQSYKNAAGIIEENYGDELFSIDKLEIIGEGNSLPLSIAAGRRVREAAINYGAAAVIEEIDYSKNKAGTAFPEEKEFLEVRTITKAEYEEMEEKRRQESISTSYEDTFAQNFEGIAP